jgi:hypothetical protein
MDVIVGEPAHTSRHRDKEGGNAGDEIGAAVAAVEFEEDNTAVVGLSS